MASTTINHKSPPPQQPLTTTRQRPPHLTIFQRTNTICNIYSLHFITLSILFLPLTISITTIIQLHLSSADVTTTLQTLTTFKNLTTLFSVIVSTVTGTGLITYSTHQAIYCTPLTFKSTFKSLSSSFIPLLSTFLAGILDLAVVSLAITLLGLGFHLNLFTISCVSLLVVVFYFVTCGLAPQIAVLELKSGFQPLRECAKNQSVKFWFKYLNTVYATGVFFGEMLFYGACVKNKESVSYWSMFVVVSLVYMQSSIVMMHFVVAATLVYVRDKVVGGANVLGDDTRQRIIGGFSCLFIVFYFIIFISFLMIF